MRRCNYGTGGGGHQAVATATGGARAYVRIEHNYLNRGQGLEWKTTMADSRSLEYVRTILRQHRTELLRDYRAVGVGIGSPDQIGRYVITVYVRRRSDIPTEARELEGVPLLFEISEEFRPQAPG